jgi:hypothetical protein
MFGQRDRDNRPGDSWPDGAGEWQSQAGIEKIDFRIALPPILNEPKSCSG